MSKAVSGHHYWTSQAWKQVIESFPTSYTVWKDGSDYRAECNRVGGSDRSHADMETLLGYIANSNTHIHFKNGTYEFDNPAGYSFNGKHDILITGDRATWKHTYAGVANQIFEVMGCDNVAFHNIIFDGNYGVTQRPAISGLAWLGRTGVSSSQVGFYNCDFLNAPDCGVVTAVVNNLTFRDCLFDNIGEHPIYFSSSGGVGTSNAVVDHCTFLNWARWVRGYGVKSDYTTSSSAKNCYFDPDEDGAGVATAGAYGGATYGAYGLVVGHSNGFHARDCTFIGDNTANPTQYGSCLYSATSDDTIFEGITCDDWDNGWFQDDDPTHYTTLRDCTFNKTYIYPWPMLTENCVFVDPPTSCVNYTTHYAIMRSNKFIRDTSTLATAVLTVSDGVKGSVVEGNQFINWVNYHIYTHATSYDTLIKDNYFSGGVAGYSIYKGTRTRIEGNTWADDVTHGTNTLVTDDGTDCTLIGNTIDPALTVTLTLANWKYIKDNIGCVSENYGASQGTGAQQTIAHGLKAIPPYVRFHDKDGTDRANVYENAAADITNIYPLGVNGKDYYWEARLTQ